MKIFAFSTAVLVLSFAVSVPSLLSAQEQNEEGVGQIQSLPVVVDTRLQDRVETSEDKIRNLQRRVDALRQSTIANHEQLQRKIDDLIGRIETLNSKIDDLQQQKPVSPADASPRAPIEESASTTTKEDASQTANLSDREQYQQAYKLLVDKKLVAARTALTAFLAQHPKSNLADNAHYWIGETHFAEKSYTKAAEQFSYTFETYPESNKAPDSLLKLGISLLRLEKKEEACITFVALLERFENAPPYILDRTKGLIQNLSCSS